MLSPPSPSSIDTVSDAVIIDRGSFHLVTKYFYIFCILLAFYVILMFPVHTYMSERSTVTLVRSETSVETPRRDFANITVGQDVELFRRENNVMRSLGMARAHKINDRVIEWQLKVNVPSLKPMAPILRANGRFLNIELGSTTGIALEDKLTIMRMHEELAHARVVNVNENNSVLEIYEYRDELLAKNGTVDITDLIATTSTAQVLILAKVSTGLFWFEIFLLLATIGLWILGICRRSLISPLFAAIVGIKQSLVQTMNRRTIMMRSLFGLVICLIAFRVVLLFILNIILVILARFNIHTGLAGFDDTRVLSFVSLLTGMALMIWLWLIFKKEDPFFLLKRRLRFRAGESAFYRVTRRFNRDIVNWLAHCVIVFVFGSALFGFLNGNTRAIATLGWARLNLHFDNPSLFFKSLFLMMSHAPFITNTEDFFAIARYTLFNVTIIGCFIGYGHTLLSIVFKRASLRWVDFTIIGWTANLICYGIWSSPVFSVFTYPGGGVAKVVNGPLLYVYLVADLLLNLAYTLSILNMGKRFGVMVDKGLVSTGFYSVVRHPSYTLEPIMFILIHLQLVHSLSSVIGLLAFPLLYWLRAERDDHFMGVANRAYGLYRTKVVDKYIPGLF